MAAIAKLHASSSPFSHPSPPRRPKTPRSSSQCRPPASPTSISRPLSRVCAPPVLTRGFRAQDLRKLSASQHIGGGSPGSVERNDAAATGPLVKPEAKLTAKEAVEAQMNALAHNDHPRADHGLEVMYNFADSDGTLNGGSLPQYFGFPSDLYHFGHFALKFKSRYPELICHSGYAIVDIRRHNEDQCEIRLKLKQARNAAGCEWAFSLSKSSRGVLPPCWLTSSLLKVRGLV